MRHRHLVHQEFTAAAIEDILDRGKMPEWEPLIAAIEADPYGKIAQTTLEICERPKRATAVCRAGFPSRDSCRAEAEALVKIREFRSTASSSARWLWRVIFR